MGGERQGWAAPSSGLPGRALVRAVGRGSQRTALDGSSLLVTCKATQGGGHIGVARLPQPCDFGLPHASSSKPQFPSLRPGLRRRCRF